MSDLESLVDAVGEGKFRLLSEERIRESYKNDVISDPTAGRPLTLEEARQFSEVVCENRGFGVAPAVFDSDEEFFEIFEDISEWGMDVYDIDILFGGSLSQDGYIDAVYVIYESVVGRGMTGQAGREFEQDILEKFGQQLSVHSEDNYGLCPFCSPNVTVDTIRNETVLRREEDLLARPNEVDFEEYPAHGRAVRLWFEE